MKKIILSALLLTFSLLASADDVEIDGICYNLNPSEKVAEVTHLHYGLGEINWSTNYRFAPANNSTGEECYAVPMDMWERLKTETFYVTIKGGYPMIYLCDGWWANMFTGNFIQPGNNLLADNGDGTWTLTVNFAGDPILDVLDERHLLFTGSGYSVGDIYLKGAATGEGSEEGQETIYVWKNGTYLSNEANIPEKITYNDVEYTVTSIGEKGLTGFSGLTSVTIPKSVTSIGRNVFLQCYKLVSVKVESGNTVYDSREDCNAIIETSTNTLVAGCKSTVIPNTVTTIGDFAFSTCSVTSITIPNSVTTIGESAFSASRLTSVDIPGSVTSIGVFAFGGCTDLVSVTIPNSVTSIGDWAFSSCMSLTSVTIPNSVKRIGNHTFAYCYDLATVIIPNSVTSICDSAFLSCTRLKDMYCHAEQVPETGTNIFDNSNQANATLHVLSASVDAYGNAEQWKDFKEIVALPVMDDYRKMVKDGKVWKTGLYGSGNPVRLIEYFYFDGDTIIDGKTCKQMMCQRYNNLDASDDDSQLSSLTYVGAWYEEDRKVYTYDTANKQFVLMYDFSVEAYDTLVINQEYYRIGPKQTGGLKGFKGVYRDVWYLVEEGNPIYSPTWLEGVGSIDGPTVNVYPGYVDPLRFLMSCTVDDEVIYFNDGYEDGATPEEMNAKKRRFDFTHTVKIQPKAPGMGGDERPKGVAPADTLSLYGEYNQQQLNIHLDPLDETYVVCITNESNEIVYEKTVNTVDLVGLNIDISTYEKGCYTATVENYYESFVGEFEVQAAGNDITLSCPDDNHPHAIDLGLPSGTKWACCNVGATMPEDYGGYYSWGETETKTDYSWNAYQHYDGTSNTYRNLGYDIAGTQYDVAHVKWGGSWVMPTKEQQDELRYNCSYEWTPENGVIGGKFTSKKNGAGIFLPAAGGYGNSGIYNVGSYGYYWSSTQNLSRSDGAYDLFFNSGYADWFCNSRYSGSTVRPVISGTNNINLPESLSNASNQAIYNIYGIKVASCPKEIDNLLPGVYITNGKKIVIK